MFLDRRDAGIQLGQALKQLKLETPLVLALPRGGVVVGYEVAKNLNADLDFLVVRKIGAPGNPEFGIGAVTEERVSWINQETVTLLGMKMEELEALITHEYAEVKKRVKLLRKGEPPPLVQDKTIIVVDDGLATGVTATTAILWLKQHAAQKIILAIPVCAPTTLSEMKTLAHQVVCLEEPSSFFSVGQWYENFEPIFDEEVLQLLKKFKKEKGLAA